MQQIVLLLAGQVRPQAAQEHGRELVLARAQIIRQRQCIHQAVFDIVQVLAMHLRELEHRGAGVGSDDRLGRLGQHLGPGAAAAAQFQDAVAGQQRGNLLARFVQVFQLLVGHLGGGVVIVSGNAVVVGDNRILVHRCFH